MTRPLEDVKVLDFTQAYSGPYCAMNLADYGARVIKVERIDVGDQSRFWGPYNKEGYSGYFSIYNRNKESLSIDLRSESGKEIIKRLYAEVDIVVENFKYGTLDKLGLGYDVAKEINPGIIFSSITGFGQTGPLKANTCYDNIAESICGFMEMTGFPELEPLRSGASVGDSYTGLTMVYAIAVAYYNKLKTGEGKRIDVAMLDTMFATIDHAVVTYGLKGEELSRTGNARPNEYVPYDLYECEDGYFAVAVTDEDLWKPFCEAIGREDLAENPDYADNDLRCEHYTELTEALKESFADKNVDDLFEKFTEAGLPGVPCLTPMECMENVQIKARDMIAEIDDKGLGMKYKAFGIPIKFSETPGEIKKGAPLLGENTADVLKEIGYDEDEINALVEDHVVGV